MAEHKLDLIQGRIRDLTLMETVLKRVVAACARHGSAPGCPLVESLTHTGP